MLLSTTNSLTKTIFLFTTISIFIASCASKGEKSNNSFRDGFEDRVTLINIGYGSRDYIATVLDKISECNPKVVGLDVFFLKPGDSLHDAHLASAIASVPTVMAVEEFKEDSYVESIPLFTKNAIAEGLVEEIDGVADVFKPFRVLRDSTGKRETLGYLSFPLVQEYDLERAKKYIGKVEVDDEYLLEYIYPKESFKVYQYENLDFDCVDIEDKIIILGYLGPAQEDRFKIPLKDENGENLEMYASVIIANQVVSLLYELEPKTP